jgi:hypothetical protein
MAVIRFTVFGRLATIKRVVRAGRICAVCVLAYRDAPSAVNPSSFLLPSQFSPTVSKLRAAVHLLP